MKSLAELDAIRQKAKTAMGLGDDSCDKIRVTVGIATCGSAAGADYVYDAFIKEIANKSLSNVNTVKVGCIGLCRYEPMVEVCLPGKEKVTYINMTPEKVAKIVEDHLINGKVVAEYTVGTMEQ